MTVDAVTMHGASKKEAGETDVAGAQQRLAAEVIKQGQEQGLALTGPDGLLGQLTKTVLESALDAEMTEHLGHAKHADQPGRESTNVRNGSRAKTVVSDVAGEVEVAVPRDREGSVEPVVVRKRQRRLGSVGEIVLSLSAKGVDHRRDFRAFRRNLWCVGVEGDGVADYRRGAFGDGRIGSPARSMSVTRPCSLMPWW